MTNTQTKPVAEGLIALLTILYLLFLFGTKLVVPPPVDADYPFDTQATLDRLERILGDEAPHPADSATSDRIVMQILSEIRALGFDPVLDDAFHCNERWRVSCARVRNIGFWVTDPGPDAIMVASHHDSVAAGPGAADDGMGVVVSLEIARIMATRDTKRPLYILITDGEEVGLIGASRFVEHDPVAPLIGAVVNLEARGTTGIANMFETSAPNGRDLAALRPSPGAWTKGATSNSLAVDIYRAMPNATDATEFLDLDVDLANYAMVNRSSHYHTPLDNLENLDPDAVFHMGASALAAVNGMMSVNFDTPDEPKIYSDVLGLGIIALPEAFGLPLIIVGLLLTGAALFRTDKTASLWRVLLMPLAALIVGGGLAFAMGWVIGAIRPEPSYGTAYPIALRGMLLAAALLGAVLMARWLYKPDGADRYLAGAWAILLGLGLAVTLAFPGAAVLFAFPALLIIPAALSLFLQQTFVARILFALGLFLMLALVLPLHAMAETALFVEGSAPLTLVMLFIFITALPLMWRSEGATRRPLIGASVTMIGFAIAAVMVPAYTADLPRGMNILHIQSDDRGEPYYRISHTGEPPEVMQAVLPFYIDSLDEFWTANAPPLAEPQLNVDVVRMDQTPEAQIIQLHVRTTGADIVQLTSAVRGAERPTSLNINGQSVSPDRSLNLRCTGRNCSDLSLEMVFEPTETARRFRVSAIAYGLAKDAEVLRAARPDWAVPRHGGDRRILQRVITIEAE